MPDAARSETDPHLYRQLRLFLEEICCEICRFEHIQNDGASPDSVGLSREVDLGAPGAFADVLVEPPGSCPYFVEIKFGYPLDKMLRHLTRKFSVDTPRIRSADHLVLVVKTSGDPRWQEIHRRLLDALPSTLRLEIWDEPRLLELVKRHFGIEMTEISLATLNHLRDAIDRAKWRHAFGDSWDGSNLQPSLLWHFGYWRLRQLHHAKGLTPDQILPPSRYRNVVVLLADLSSFSAYVRDTRDDEVMRNALTTFYSNARYAILNAGGMMYQFVGDEVVSLFGVPEPDHGYLKKALECARALTEIGNSVSNKWQREIDRVQKAGGVHIGIGMGDIEIVSLRPYCRAHIGAIGDSINLAARLMAHAGPSEMVVANTYFQKLDEADQAGFEELAPIDCRNIGLIKSWKLRLAGPIAPHYALDETSRPPAVSEPPHSVL
ncbi:MAG: adenylate/guanylate cyclase domain-containing protein [Deltaproteobacteria bacterium]|nr:adenylate/guanylate cyclase domain-containing protein [Deltaproteobacteria bacterium]